MEFKVGKTPVHLRQFLSEDRARDFEQTFAATVKLSGLAKDCLNAGDIEGASYYEKLDDRFSGVAFKLTDAERAALHVLTGSSFACLGLSMVLVRD